MMPREPASAPIRRGHAADRQTAEPATRGAGFATAFPATWPAAAPALFANAARAIHATRDAASRPSWANGAIGMPSADVLRIYKDV